MPVEGEETITGIKGIGSTTVSRLRDAGFTSVESIAVTPKKELVEKTGIGDEAAR